MIEFTYLLEHRDVVSEFLKKDKTEDKQSVRFDELEYISKHWSEFQKFVYLKTIHQLAIHDSDSDSSDSEPDNEYRRAFGNLTGSNERRRLTKIDKIVNFVRKGYQRSPNFEDPSEFDAERWTQLNQEIDIRMYTLRDYNEVMSAIGDQNKEHYRIIYQTQAKSQLDFIQKFIKEQPDVYQKIWKDYCLGYNYENMLITDDHEKLDKGKIPRRSLREMKLHYFKDWKDYFINEQLFEQTTIEE